MSDIVISGIAGRFPQSDNVEEFKENLLNKVYLVGDPENRVKFKFARQAQNYGLMRNLDKFDYQAFRVPSFIAKCCDPQGRILAEHVYEAIYDAGVSPKSLQGSKTGVYVGCFNYDSLEHWMFNKDTSLGMTSIGNTAYALSNRLSFLLGVHGPSFTVDTACSSSMYALNLAFKDLMSGECDAAIVAGSNLILNPFITKDFSKAGVLAHNGISQPFDKGSSGFVRSEACCVLFLQKLDKARRVYATVLNSKSNNDGFKIEGPTVPSVKLQKQLFQQTYGELNLHPNDVDFIEAHATSTGIGDRGEITSIDEFFCSARKDPLIVGSVKGNMGHSEGASGAVSMAKAILMFETGKVLPNINITELRPDCPGLIEGRIKVLREVDNFNGKIIGVNSFGVLGANAHAVIKRNEKVKVDGGFPSDNMPRLLLWAGRTVSAVNKVFDRVLSEPIDDEFLALLQSSQIESSVATLTRGFGIFKSNDDRSTICIDRQVKELDKSNRPIVFVYPGVGSQWNEMGRDLMRIPSIMKTINECHEILMTKGVNLKDILTSTSPNTFKSCLSIFLGVTSIQIALTDLLFKVGVKPNFFIGHSVGELGCAYADGTLTLEQTILTAYSRGMSIIEGVEEPGMMAAVAMRYDELKNILPQDIEIACHNSVESCTISGPIESVQTFVTFVKSKNYLAKIVDSSNVAFHSSLIAKCGPIFAEKLRKIITDPKKRSLKWISTSTINDQDNFSSVEYHVNNMLSPVRFAEGISKLPEDALMIEIAPHGLLLPLLKQSIPEGVSISLTQRGSQDGEIFLLQSLGKIYQSGIDMDIRQIYPEIEFPVSRGTPMISPLVEWLHDESFEVPMYDPFMRCDKRNLTINLNNPLYSIMKGHQLDDRIIFPGTGYIYIAVESLAMMHGLEVEKFPVCIEDIRFMKSIILDDSKEIDLTITIQRGSGEFEIVEKDESICRGKIRPASENEFVLDPIGENLMIENVLDKKDFYKELKLRGYQYKGDFQLIQKIQNFTGSRRFGKMEWTKSFISFIDCMVQSHITNTDSRELALPISVRKVVIDPLKHSLMIKNSENCHTSVDENGQEKIIFDILIDDKMAIYRSGGVEVTKPEFHVVSRRKNLNEPVLETYEFVSHSPTQKLTPKNAAKFFVQLFIENSLSGKMNIAEIDDEKFEPLMFSISSAIKEIPLITPTCHLLTSRSVDEIEDVTILDIDKFSTMGNFDILVIPSVEKLREISEKINAQGFILLRNSSSLASISNDFMLIATVQLNSETISIYRKCSKFTFEGQVFEVPSALKNFEWVEKLKKLLDTSDEMIIYSRFNLSGVLGFFKCLIKEMPEKSLKCFIIDDEKAPNFDLSNQYYKNQIELGLTVNILKGGKWGSYRHLSFSQEIEAKPLTEHAFVHLLTKGDFSSLSWVNGHLKSTDDDIINIHYSALNFRDILVANQRISVDYEYENRTIFQYKCGFEFSGMTSKGKKVAGMSGVNGFSNIIKEIKDENDLTIFNIPDHYTLEEAATIPIIYGTVYFAFFFKTKIESGKTILIHAGSGGLGQAAIRTAITYGLKVFTTVGSAAKREFLLKEFPELTNEDIGNSRDTSFEKMISERTNGRGVDYVLNSLAEDKMQASLRCLAEGGTFYEVGKYDILAGNHISLTHFLKEIKYVGIFLSSKLFKKNPQLQKDLVKKIEEDIQSGKIKPIKRTVFNANEVEKAFRFMASGKHIGKVLLQIRESENNKVTLPIQVKPRIFFDREKVFIIPGGLGGMGLEIADWMIMRNCKKLVLSSSRGISNSYQSYRIRIWESYGVKVRISKADITTREGCEELIKSASELGPIGGIFNLAANLQDGLFQNQSAANFEKSFKPKALSTKHLDDISRSMCSKLDFFVVFSSVSCGRGNGGQSNYGLSNSVTERIIEQRRADNLPGKVIQWGPIGDVGMLENVESAAFYGFILQGIHSCLDVMDKVLYRNESIFSSIVCASKKKSGSKHVDLFSTLISALGIGEVNSIDQNLQLASLGLDSISGTEIQQVFERELGISISLKEIRSKTLKEIQDIIQSSSGKPLKPKDIAKHPPTLNMNEIPFMPLI